MRLIMSISAASLMKLADDCAARSLVREHGLEMFQVNGIENVAYLLTKHLSSETILIHLQALSCWVRQRRAASAPQR